MNNDFFFFIIEFSGCDSVNVSCIFNINMVVFFFLVPNTITKKYVQKYKFVIQIYFTVVLQKFIKFIIRESSFLQLRYLKKLKRWFLLTNFLKQR